MAAENYTVQGDVAAPDWLPAILGVAGLPQRRAIAKSITLLESTRADHRAQADALLTALLPHTGKSLRLGISGVPGETAYWSKFVVPSAVSTSSSMKKLPVQSLNGRLKIA